VNLFAFCLQGILLRPLLNEGPQSLDGWFCDGFALDEVKLPLKIFIQQLIANAVGGSLGKDRTAEALFQ